ncbi:MAG TPA: ROK family protein [Candidatus Polarisedimenticolia bacterium]|nr:ROK family protein [Candidatus Polarisedimenticolia bacterium]
MKGPPGPGPIPGERLGGIEAGGTKFVCAVGSCPDDLRVASFATEDPPTTIGSVVGFFRDAAPHAVGVGSFGPLDLDHDSPTFGHITTTPKHGWRGFDLAGAISRALGVPVAFDTDVNAAALGEGRWGAARGLSDFVYLTVGTGIGGGAVVGGKVLHGLVHPEMGHIPVPHDRARDPYPGACPYHGDCLEGLASGPAIERRWGLPAAELPPDHPAWELEAHYLALGLATWVCTLSPRRIVIGGGVMRAGHLFPRIRAELQRVLNGYLQADALDDGIDRYLTPPGLGDRSGVLGALVLAEQALAEAGPASPSAGAERP